MNTINMNEQIRQFHQNVKNPQEPLRVYSSKTKFKFNPVCFHCKQRNDDLIIDQQVYFCNKCRNIIDYYHNLFESKACSRSVRKKRTYHGSFYITGVTARLCDKKLIIKTTMIQFQKIHKEIGDFLYTNHLSKDSLSTKNFCNCMAYGFDQILGMVNDRCEYITADYKCSEKGPKLLDDYIDIGGTIVVDYNTTTNRYNLHWIVTVIKES